MHRIFLRILFYSISGIFAIILLGAAALGLSIMAAYPRLPSLNVLTDYRPKIPLRVFTQDGLLIGEFGEERRAFITIDKVPLQMKQALIAAEDERFYEHGGVDYIGVLRAMLGNVSGSGPKSGASTITMQVAKNFFLSPEQTLARKFNEALLAFKIEHNLSKDQILELYMNQIYLGQRAYGFASASQTYFGKTLEQANVAELAMLAGLPKAPSKYNPIVNFKRSKQRQEYVLRRMHDLKFLTDEQYQIAIATDITPTRKATESLLLNAEYVAEMARQSMIDRYGDAAYTQGFKVFTTVDSSMQQAAYEGLRNGVMDYDLRHGYRGAEAYVDLEGIADTDIDRMDEEVIKFQDSGDLLPGIVLKASTREVTVYLHGGNIITIKGDGLRFAQRMIGNRTNPNGQIRRGAVIRVQQTASGSYRIRQLPEVEAALVSVDPNNGAIKSLVGGFDFTRNRFNHVSQAWRQPGSSFKPFVYSAALERGFTPTTMINDAPLVVDPALVGGQKWEPKNYDGSFSGMISMRSALTFSKNLVSVRILQSITPEFAQQYLGRFGFKPEKHPAYLTMALGAGMVTPLEMASGYSTFANGGYRVMPYFIDRIEDQSGRVLARTSPAKAGSNAVQTLDPRNAFIMTMMMKEVIDRGTATLAKSIGRNDLAGKTGTTNDQHDAWFAGYQRNLVAVAWIGFDQPKSLGHGETGGHTALPLWVKFMNKALKNEPEYEPPLPPRVIARNNGTRTDYYYEEFADAGQPDGLNNNSNWSPEPAEQTMDTPEVKDELF